MQQASHKLLFIGSFPEQSQGGTSTASILLKDAFEHLGWEVFAIDSTLRDNRHNSWANRIKRGLNRRRELLNILKHHAPSHAFIMCGHGLSFLEKGYWMQLLQTKGLHVGLAPRSGLIVQNLKNPLFKILLRSIIRQSQHVFCQGKFWTEFYGRYHPSQPEKFHPLHNWVESRHESTEQTRPPDETFTVTLAGWITRDKGLFDLIDIARRVRNDTSRECLINVYGKGPDEKRLLLAIQENGLDDIITLHPWKPRSELFHTLRSSHCLLFLSRFEGMANILLEAQMAGLPVLATNISTNPEIIQEGETGFLFNPGDTRSFAAALVKLMEDYDLRNSFSRNAVKFAADFPGPMNSARFIAKQLTQQTTFPT